MIQNIQKPFDLAEFVVFDIETTGGNPSHNNFLEFFGIKVRGKKILKTYHSLINPKIPIPSIIRRMTGLDNKQLANEPIIQDVMPEILRFIGSSVVVSHNVLSDLKFLRYYSEKVCHQFFDNFFICTHLLAKIFYPSAKDKTLKGIAQYIHVNVRNIHRAKDDAYLSLEVFRDLQTKFCQKHLYSVVDAIRLQGDIGSLKRLGLIMDDDSFSSVTGLCYFFDWQRCLTMIVLFSDAQREMKQLMYAKNTARKVFKKAHQSFSFRFIRKKSLLSTLLHVIEQETSILHPDMLYWQPNPLSVFHIRKLSDQKYEFLLGSLSDHSVFAYDFHKNLKKWEHVIEILATYFPLKCSRRSVVVDPYFAKFFMTIFEHGVDLAKKEILEYKRNVTLWIYQKRRQSVKAILDIFEQTSPDELKGRYEGNALVLSGLLVVFSKGVWKIYLTKACQIIRILHFTENPIPLLFKTSLGQDLYKYLNEASVIHKQGSLYTRQIKLFKSVFLQWFFQYDPEKSTDEHFFHLDTLKEHLNL